MNRVIVCVALCLASAAAQPFEALSPDHKVALRMSAGTDGVTYSADYLGRPALLPSRLGLSLYSGRFHVIGSSRTPSRKTWRPVYGERASIPDHYNELTIRLRDLAAPHRELHVIARAYNEGIAIRYRLPGTGNFLFATEHTEFRLPDNSYVWEEHGTEGEYSRVPAGQIKAGYERQLTVDLTDRFLSIAEAGNLDSPRMLLSPVRGRPGSIAVDLGGAVHGLAPFETPWRVVVMGERPGDLMERSYLLLNLSPPSRLKDTSWVKPGKAIREVTLSTAGGKAAVDFAVARGLQYIEYDAGWYGHEYDEASDATTVSPDPDRTRNIPDYRGLDLQEVLRYARSKGIGVWLYINRRALERQLDDLLPLYRTWGVKGLKFGFVNTGPQEWTQWLHEAVRKAGEHGLMVDVHDSYRPTGTSRTYPHWLTQEGIRGNEHMPSATHNTVLPFTRMVAGAGDYTICYYTPRLRTTRAHQLALAVIMYSPLQFLFWYDQPSAFNGEPEVKFFHDVPTVFDDTKVVDGRIGEFIVVARRRGREWFVGAITNDNARELVLPLTFLEPGQKYTAEIYSNGRSKNDVEIDRRIVDAAIALKAVLPAAGGYSIRLVPE